MKLSIAALLNPSPRHTDTSTSARPAQQTPRRPETPRARSPHAPANVHTPTQQPQTPRTPRNFLSRLSPRTPALTRADVERAVRLVGRGVKRGILDSPLYEELRKLVKRVRGDNSGDGQDEDEQFGTHPVLGPPASIAVDTNSAPSRPTGAVRPTVSLPFPATPQHHPRRPEDEDLLSSASESLAFAPPPPADPGLSFELWTSPSATFTLDKPRKINRTTSVSKIIHWPRGAFIEYPESAAPDGVIHIIPVDKKSYTNPLRDFAYSLSGESHGQLSHQTCYLLVDRDEKAVSCTKIDRECASIKACAFSDLDVLRTPHCYATRSELERRLAGQRESRAAGYSEVNLLVEKTAAFFAALMQEGCSAKAASLPSASAGSAEPVAHPPLAEPMTARRGQPRKAGQCTGRIVFGRDARTGRPFVKCEHHSASQRLHFFDSDRLENIDTRYLEALFESDWEYIDEVEQSAARSGYGPLAPCTTQDNNSSQRAYCPKPHRKAPHSPLVLGELKKIDTCNARYTLYRPDDLDECPFVAVLCKGVHQHVMPLPKRTPQRIWRLLDDILMEMDWELANATPRIALRNEAVVARLHQVLPGVMAPSFKHLHSSLGDDDHVRVYIDQVKKREFPYGTGLQGVTEYMKRQQAQRPKEALYIRRIFKYPRPESEGGGEYIFVVCMRPGQSWALLRALTWQIDTTFKRVIGWLEFEGTAYDHILHRNVVFCRVFFNAQDHKAHSLLLHLLDDVVHEDTGSFIQWRHLDSPDLATHKGIRLVIADEHKGEALGVGCYFQEICQQRYAGRADLHQPERLLTSLGPYEHLARLYRLCHVHFSRKINEMKSVDYQTKQLMKSISCVEHHDLDGTLDLLRHSPNEVVRNWLYDKEVASPFAVPGLCGERSLVPKEILRVYERDTNSNESAHANANREGTKGTLLGGILRGERLDIRNLDSMENEAQTGIRKSRKGASELARQIRNARRRSNQYTRTVMSADKRIVEMNLNLEGARKKIALRRTNLTRIQEGVSSDKQLDLARKQLRNALDDLEKLKGKARQLQYTGSGQIHLDVDDSDSSDDDADEDVDEDDLSDSDTDQLWEQGDLFADADLSKVADTHEDETTQPGVSTPPPEPEGVVTRTGRRICKPRLFKDFIPNETPEKERQAKKQARGRRGGKR